MSKRSPRLLFSDEELAALELKKVIKKAISVWQAGKAEAKIPQKKVKARVVDAKPARSQRAFLLRTRNARLPSSPMPSATLP